MKPPVAAPPSFTVSPPPARTTRSTSLPWIEVTEAPSFDRMRPPAVPRNSGSNGTVAIPARNGNGNGSHGAAASHTMPAQESPLAFHPIAAAPPVSRNSAPQMAASAPPEVEIEHEAHAKSPFTSSFARMVAETPSGRNAIVHESPPPTTHRISDPRPEISLDWPIEPRRPWLKIFVGVLVLGAIAGGGWYFLSRMEGAPTPAAAAAAAKPRQIVAAPTDTLAVKHESVPAGPPASVVKPGVASVIVPTSKSEATAPKAQPTAPKLEPAVIKPVFNPNAPASLSAHDEGPPADAKHATHVAATPAAAEDEIAAPVMPSIKVDAITNMIDDSARHRADSVGSDIQQKPPTFKPKTYKPPT